MGSVAKATAPPQKTPKTLKSFDSMSDQHIKMFTLPHPFIFQK